MPGVSIYGELLSAQLQNLSADPVAYTCPGLVYFNTTSKLVRWYTGTAWISPVDETATQEISNKTFISGTTFLKNATGTNRKIGFDLGAATDSTTATLTFIQSANAAYTFPSTSATLAGLTSTQTFTNKTFSDEVQVRNLYATGTGGDGTLELKFQSVTPSLRDAGVANTHKFFIGAGGKFSKLSNVGTVLDLESAVISSVATVTTNATLVPGRLHLVNTSAARTVALPNTTINIMSLVVVKDATGGAGTYNITVNAPVPGTLEGGSQYILNTPYESATFISDGTNWYVI